MPSSVAHPDYPFRNGRNSGIDDNTLLKIMRMRFDALIFCTTCCCVLIEGLIVVLVLAQDFYVHVADWMIQI